MLYINDITQTLSIYIMGVIITMVVIGALYITVNVLWLRKRVVLPLKKIGDCMGSFAASSHGDDSGGNIEIFDPGIGTRDEIQSLSEQTVDMMNRLKENISEIKTITAEKERIGAELNVATRIQNDMMPVDFPKRDDFGLYASMTPAKEVGGDFYDFFFVDDDHLGLVIADVSGKGVPAALFMAITKTILRNATINTKRTPSKALELTNRIICETNGSGYFVTAWIGVLTLSTGDLIYVNAGHEYPALMHKDGDFTLIESENYPPLATLDEIEYTDSRMTLQAGDKLFLYTDGIPEAKAPDGSRFTLDRLLKLLNSMKKDSPEEIVKAVKREVDAFQPENDPFDDVTMLSIVWNGKDR